MYRGILPKSILICLACHNQITSLKLSYSNIHIMNLNNYLLKIKYHIVSSKKGYTTQIWKKK